MCIITMSKNTGQKKRQRKFIHFEHNVLEELVKAKNTCVEVHRLTKHIHLHPFYLNNVKESIKEILSRNVGRYDKKLNGIFMGFKNAKVDGTAPIYDENCFITVKMEADFYLFKPEIGKVLEGVVVKKTADHIGALVHNAFNISIPKSDDWLGENVHVGQELRMTIIFTNFEGRFPFIKANIESILTEVPALNGSQNKITRFNEDGEAVTHKKKKGKKQKLNLDETPKSVKKGKRKRSISESFTNNNEEEVISPSKKVKKEHKESLEVPEKKQKRKRTKSESFVDKSVNSEDDFQTPLAKKAKKDAPNVDTKDLEALLLKAQNLLEDSKKKSKKKSKTKHEDSIDDLQKLLVSQISDKLNSKKKKSKSKDTDATKELKQKARKLKREQSFDMDNLKLDEIFSQNTAMKFNNSSINMADAVDKGLKNNSHHTGVQWNDSFNLPSDSDMEAILNSNKHKKKTLKLK